MGELGRMRLLLHLVAGGLKARPTQLQHFYRESIMRFCKVCKAVLHDGSKDICSRACQETLRQYKKREYDKRKRKERWYASNRRLCQVCGVLLKSPGGFCKQHQKHKKVNVYVPAHEREYRFENTDDRA